MLSKEELKNTLKNTYFEDKVEDVISINDKIEFECIRCGKCCTNRGSNGEVIMLSPLDIYNACNKLDITINEFVKEYTDSYTGRTSGAIVMVLDSKDNGDCKFLEYDENKLAKCKIHDAKPTICAVHPLGLMHSKNANSDDDFSETQYIVAAHCDESQHGVMTKVKDIVDSIKGTDEEIKAAMDVRTTWLPNEGLKTILDKIMLHSILMSGLLTEEGRKELNYSDRMYNTAKTLVQIFEDNVGPLNMIKPSISAIESDIMAPVFTHEINMKFSYLNYDLSKPFLEQCKENIETLKEYSESLVDLYEKDWNDITGKLSDAQKKELPNFMFLYPIMVEQLMNN